MTREDFDRVNNGCAFPEGIEGYWRNTEIKTDPITDYESKVSTYPWPVAFEVEGYDADDFVDTLIRIQSSDSIKRIAYRGVSIHRLTGKPNGNTEFEFNGVKWPEGYINYLKLGVPPSRYFYQFITGEDLPSLPTYGR